MAGTAQSCAKCRCVRVPLSSGPVAGVWRFAVFWSGASRALQCQRLNIVVVFCSFHAREVEVARAKAQRAAAICREMVESAGALRARRPLPRFTIRGRRPGGTARADG